MHCYTRPTQIRNRCILGGKGRGVLRDFKMTRVGFLFLLAEGVSWARGWKMLTWFGGQYNFRMQALEGNLPGVKKASW